MEAREHGLNKGEVARLFGVSLSSVKRFSRMAREGRPLAPRKAPGKRPKIDERGKGLPHRIGAISAPGNITGSWKLGRWVGCMLFVGA